MFYELREGMYETLTARGMTFILALYYENGNSRPAEFAIWTDTIGNGQYTPHTVFYNGIAEEDDIDSAGGPQAYLDNAVESANRIMERDKIGTTEQKDKYDPKGPQDPDGLEPMQRELCNLLGAVKFINEDELDEPLQLG